MTTQAKFTTGSTMRHVVVMTMTASAGLLSLFFVDAINLFYISLLGVTELAAAIGFAGTIQFFMISVSIGLVIAGVATVSRAVGAGETERARQLASASMITTLLFMGVVAALTWSFRDEALALLGAEGEALEQASHFLAIALVSVPLLGIGMASAATLRAIGEAKHAMYVTLSGGAIAAVLDPVLIFGLDLGLTGAAFAIVLTRLAIAGIGLWLVVGRHQMLARPSLPQWLADLPKLAVIAGPAMATQLSTPFGMAYLTRTVAEAGDEAVAGWAVIGRITALTFGGIFALAGAIGPIIGQNYGAGLCDRIAMIYRDALIFMAVYVLAAWTVLWLVSGLIIQGFGIVGPGAEIFAAFAAFGAGGYLFAGALFVSNAAFNNLGRPLWSTGFNWSRDALAIPALVALLATTLGTAAVVYVQAMAGVLVGTVAGVVGWRLVHSLVDERGTPTPTPIAAIVSGRGAEAVTSNPLASVPENR